MNCPSCGCPLLFGAVVCECGYQRGSAEPSSIELSYWEALRAYWRVYWPAQLLGLVGYLPILFFRVSGSVYRLQLTLTPVEQILLQAVLGAIALFLYVHRIVSSSFREFSIYVVTDTAGQAKLNLRRRTAIWFFLWWRQLVAGIIAPVLAAPLNVLLSLFGLRVVFGINVGLMVSTLAAILAIGPILLKMLIGQQFSDFRLEVERFSAGAKLARTAAGREEHGNIVTRK